MLSEEQKLKQKAQALLERIMISPTANMHMNDMVYGEHVNATLSGGQFAQPERKCQFVMFNDYDRDISICVSFFDDDTWDINIQTSCVPIM
jgi:hypothetical protein